MRRLLTAILPSPRPARCAGRGRTTVTRWRPCSAAGEDEERLPGRRLRVLRGRADAASRLLVLVDEPVAGELLVERRPVDAGELGGLRDAAARLAQEVLEEPPLPRVAR